MTSLESVTVKGDQEQLDGFPPVALLTTKSKLLPILEVIIAHTCYKNAVISISFTLNVQLGRQCARTKTALQIKVTLAFRFCHIKSTRINSLRIIQFNKRLLEGNVTTSAQSTHLKNLGKITFGIIQQDLIRSVILING